MDISKSRIAMETGLHVKKKIYSKTNCIYQSIDFGWAFFDVIREWEKKGHLPWNNGLYKCSVCVLFVAFAMLSLPLSLCPFFFLSFSFCHSFSNCNICMFFVYMFRIYSDKIMIFFFLEHMNCWFFCVSMKFTVAWRIYACLAPILQTIFSRTSVIIFTFFMF